MSVNDFVYLKRDSPTVDNEATQGSSFVGICVVANEAVYEGSYRTSGSIVEDYKILVHRKRIFDCPYPDASYRHLNQYLYCREGVFSVEPYRIDLPKYELTTIDGKYLISQLSGASYNSRLNSRNPRSGLVTTVYPITPQVYIGRIVGLTNNETLVIER